MSKLMATSRLLRGAILGMLALAGVGCGPQFDPPSKLQSLRVLAVKKDDPYLRPRAESGAAGDTDGTYRPDNTARMTLALEDARLEEDKQGPLQKLWFAGCNNPPRDNYFTCLLNVWLSFKAFSELGPGALADGQAWSLADLDISDSQRILDFLEEVFPGFSASGSEVTDPNGDPLDTEALIAQAAALRVGAGDSFEYTVPPTIIDEHPRPVDRDIPRYGLSQVFLAVCDGEIGVSPSWQENVDPLAVLTDATRGFPLTCYERGTTKERGPDHFMVAYSNLYVFEELKNKNPIIQGFEFDGKVVPEAAICIGEACGASEPSCDEATELPVVDLCDPDSPSGCKEYEITPTLSEDENSELDDIASRVGGGDARLLEQMWIRYYADRGEIARDTKRLQDATSGWFPEHGTKWTAPSKEEGPVHLWSVVHDNRGGVDWARITVCLRK